VSIRITATGVVKFSVRGAGGHHAVPAARLPLSASVVLDLPRATTGRCTVAAFPGPRPAPSCTYTAGGALICR